MSERVVVVGDALLDRDLDGRADRLAPDAPVPVVRHPVAAVRPGGAALAALLAARDGGDVTLVTALGADSAGREIRTLLEREHVQVVDLERRGATPVKTRVRAGGQTLLRIDDDDGDDRLRAPERAIPALRTHGGAVLVADYGRGVARAADVREALTGAAARVPVVWDPHPLGPVPIPGVKLATPNRSEASVDGERIDGVGSAARAATHWCDEWRANAVAVTLGEDGAVLGIPGRLPLAVPAPFRAVGDPCGAGDRFSATAAVELARGALVSEAVSRAVTSATAFVGNGGVRGLAGRAPSRAVSHGDDEATERPHGTVVATSGCFDLLHAGHVAMLNAARALGDHLVVLLNSDRSVQNLKGAERPIVTETDRAAVLRGLACVDDVVIFDETTPTRALEQLRPALFVKGDDYGSGTIPEERVMAAWGGAVVVVPYLEGRSTTGLIEEVSRDG